MKQFQSSAILTGIAAVILTSQSAQAATATQVTGVQLNPTARGLSVFLATAPGNAQVLHPQMMTSIQGNATVTNITNAQLNLRQGKSFRTSNPAPGIASVVVTQLNPSTVQMVVTGTTQAPKNEIALSNAAGITLSFSSVASTTTAAPSSTPANPTVGRLATSPQLAASPNSAQPPAVQIPYTRTPGNVLVPNPNITIDNKPVSPGKTTDSSVSPGQATDSNSPAPPSLPRAIAPPVGDIAVSNTDSSPAAVDLGTSEHVPRLVLRDAPAREVLALLAHAAGLNLVFTNAPATTLGQPPIQASQPASAEGPTVSLDIENESVQDVFNYVLSVSGLQANREGNTILVGTTLPNEARNVIVRSFRLNQVQVGVALNFLVGMGAESAVSRERVITSVSAVPVGGSPTPATQTQTSTETRVETQRINFQDTVPLLRGLQAVGDERTNSVTLIGSPKQVDIATTQLVQLDARRRQVAINVKIVDVNLNAAQDFNTSFSFGIGNNFFNVSGGQAAVNVGNVVPPSNTQVITGPLNPPITGTPLPQGISTPQPFLNLGVPTDPNTFQGARAPFGSKGNPLQPGLISPGSTTITVPTTGPAITTTNPPTYALPFLFQYPTKFLSLLQAQVTSGTAKILTDPTLIVQEGQQANVNLTQQVVGNVSTQTNFTAGAAIQTVNVTKEQVGLTLSVRIERIDDNGFIALSVAPVVRAPQNQQTINLGGGNSQTIVLINERSLNSGVIRLRDSQTLILSGIIQDSDQTTTTKVPILGDIPILGALFRSTNKNHQRQEVIVLLTPQIIDDSVRATYGYNYTPGPEVRQILENQGLRVPRGKK